MAAYKKEEKKSDGLSELREALKNGTAAPLYIFTGEESYLREYYLGELRRTLVPAGFETFNFHRCEGKELTVRSLAEMAEAMPMLAERTLIVATDFDPYRLAEAEREAFIALITDFPPACCLVLHYDVLEYHPNRTMKKLCAAMDAQFQTVEFRPQSRGDLIPWIRKHFRALGKEIDANTAEHLIFTCGELMTGLLPEIEKIGAYAGGRQITPADIDAVADPVLDAVVFDMTNAVSEGDYGRSAALLGELLKQQEEPVKILGAMGRELQQLYSARLAIDGGRDKSWLMGLWNMRSDYPAKRLLASARRVTTRWCREGLLLAQRLDRRMKSEKTADGEEELKLFLMELAQGMRL